MKFKVNIRLMCSITLKTDAFESRMLYNSRMLVDYNYCKLKRIRSSLILPKYVNGRHLYTSFKCLNKFKDLVVYENFETIRERTKNTYLEMVRIFESRDIHRRGYVEFIYSALKHMENFGVHKDLEVYKALIDVFPKGKLISANVLEAEFMHYPKQQQCAIDLLEQMEDNGVMPDNEVETMLLNVFGQRGYPLRKFWRMMYWMPKFKNLSPWLLPEKLPNEVHELAKLAMSRVGTVDIQSKLAVYETADIPDSIENTWIVSIQSETQQHLLSEHDINKPIYIEGPFRIWIKNRSVNYFILRADSKPTIRQDYDSDDISHIISPVLSCTPLQKKDLVSVPSVYEQMDGIIYAVCVTGTSGRDSLLSWIRHLEKDGNASLTCIPLVFTLHAPETEIANIDVTDKIKENS